jgi:hypothetical protein
MKLRIKGNSVRFRLDRRDLAELVKFGLVEDAVTFGPGADQQLLYAVEIGNAKPGSPSVCYTTGRVAVHLHRHDAESWAGSDLVGFDSESSGVRVLLEKDFACIDRPAGEEPDDTWAFPTPSMVC